MQDTRVAFLAKARTDEDTGERYVSLVSPAEHHIDGDRMVTARAVGAYPLQPTGDDELDTAYRVVLTHWLTDTSMYAA